MKSKILFLLMTLSMFAWAQITVDSSSVVARVKHVTPLMTTCQQAPSV